MHVKNIFPTWGTTIEIGFKEFIEDNQTSWADLLLERNLIVFKGFGPGLSDPEFFNFGAKFGKVWTIDDYRAPVVGETTTMMDLTVNDTATDTPVSHFTSNNNPFQDGVVGYHADMVHIGKNSYPGRALYMTRNAINNTGVTSWLNLEYGWEQCTEQEKSVYDNIEIANHNMFMANQFVELFPFLKTNPKTGKVSPRLNSMAWVNHMRNSGTVLTEEQTKKLSYDLIEILEKKPNTLYEHHWDEGDIVVYDNWFNLHKRSKVEDTGVPGGRLLRRVSFNFE